MRVLALDPGERVGWASAVVDSRLSFPDGTAVAECALLPEQWVGKADEGTWKHTLEITGHGIAYLKDMALAVHQAVVVEKKYDVVVFEKWVLTAKGARVSVGSHMESSQFVGMVRLCCWLAGVKVVGQPTSALSSADRSLKCGHPSAAAVAKLVEAADSVSHDDGHDGSALRHLWTFFFDAYV